MKRAACLILLAVVTAGAQEFGVATVKSSRVTGPGELININLGTFRNGRLTFTNASLSDCLKYAYELISDAQIAGPDWVTSKAVRFDIVAEASPDTPPPDLRGMLRALLADRLKLTVHHEEKEMSFLALVQGKGGIKIPEAKPDAAYVSNGMRGRIVGSRMPMERLALLLSRFERETVVDQTGLKGLFDVRLEWTPDDSAAQNDATSGPSIFAALQEQLGLRLERRKGPVDVVVVDHVEKVPTEN